MKLPSNADVQGWLWSYPPLKHWQRLLLGVFYLPILFWWWLMGWPIALYEPGADQERTA